MDGRKNGIRDLAAENAQLQAELARYKTLVEHLSMGVYVYKLEDRANDRTLRMVAANRAVEPLAGLAPELLIGKTLDENFPGLRAQGIPQAYAEVVRNSALLVTEVAYGDERVNSSAFTVQAIPLPGDEVGVLFDNVTAQKQVEQALRESQEMLQTFFDHLPVAVMLKAAADGRFILWNSACQRLFGARAEDVIGKTDHELFPQEIADALWAKHQAVLATGMPDTTSEETIHSSQLGPIPASITRVPIYDDSGSATHLIMIASDLSEQRRAADERTALHAQIIQAQQSALQELSTPLLPLSSKVVLMPIIGAMDSRRAQQVIETLLHGVAEYNAEIAIVDITGVQVVDTQVANAFIQSARAVQLLGARVMLTGIRPEVAQTLVQLGVDLQGMLTRGSLQAGIAYAFGR